MYFTLLYAIVGGSEAWQRVNVVTVDSGLLTSKSRRTTHQNGIEAKLIQQYATCKRGGKGHINVEANVGERACEKILKC
jgi:hypothetical protein